MQSQARGAVPGIKERVRAGLPSLGSPSSERVWLTQAL